MSELFTPRSQQGLQSSPGPHRCSVATSPQLTPPQAPPSSPLPHPILTVTPSTLWQDLDEVKSSGLLGGMTPREIRLQEVWDVFILYTSNITELHLKAVLSSWKQRGKVKNHSSSSSSEVHVRVDRFRGVLSKEPANRCQSLLHVRSTEADPVSNGASRFVFQHPSCDGSQWEVRHKIRLAFIWAVVFVLSWGPFSSRFLMDLEIRLGENVLISQVGDIVLRHCPEFHSLYVPYVSNMMYQEAVINQLLWVCWVLLIPLVLHKLYSSAILFFLAGSRTESFSVQSGSLRATRYVKDRASSHSSSSPSRELLVSNSS